MESYVGISVSLRGSAVIEALLDEVDMGRIALSCRFSLYVLCDKTSSLPVMNDHIFVRTWPPSE